MKKIITIAALLLFSITSIAQIKKINKINNRVSVKNVPSIITSPKRIKSASFKNLKPQQIAKLPAATFNRTALLGLKINKSWVITPNRMRDKDMYVVKYFGKYQVRPKYISIYPENKYYPRLDRGAPGFLPESRMLILQFSPEIGKRYRLRLKLKPGNYRGKKIITDTSGGSYSDSWYINDQYDEVMFDFIASSKKIKITPIIAGYERYYIKYEPLEIEKINIDKVEE